MNDFLERGRQFAHVARQWANWLLAVEGLMMSLLFLISIGWGLFKQLSFIQRQPTSVKISVTLFCLLALSSTWSTAGQMTKKDWTTVPGTLLFWLVIGGGFLLFLLLNKGVQPGWELPDLILLSSIALNVYLSSLATIGDILLTKWLQKEDKKRGESL